MIAFPNRNTITVRGFLGAILLVDLVEASTLRLISTLTRTRRQSQQTMACGTD